MSVTEELGAQHEIETSAGTIRYRERGSGEPIVFVHGLLVNGDLWRKVVPLLADRYRCIVPDWPLGSHELPLRSGADRTPRGIARIVTEFLDRLGLDGVTLVGNDTGSAIVQLVLAERPKRVARAVLTTGDAFENFLPPRFKPLQWLARVPGALWLSGQATRGPVLGRVGYAPLSETLRDARIFDSYTGPGRRSAGVRRDLAKVLRAVSSSYTLQAAAKLGGFTGPVLIAWAADESIFPNEHAERLAKILPDARVEWIKDSRAFVPEDQPRALADAIGAFLAPGAVAAEPQVA